MTERAPTEAELAEEDRRRSEVTVVPDLLNMDLADPETPSRRQRGPAVSLDDEGEPVGFDLPLRDWRDPEAAG